MQHIRIEFLRTSPVALVGPVSRACPVLLLQLLRFCILQQEKMVSRKKKYFTVLPDLSNQIFLSITAIASFPKK